MIIITADFDPGNIKPGNILVYTRGDKPGSLYIMEFVTSIDRYDPSHPEVRYRLVSVYLDGNKPFIRRAERGNYTFLNLWEVIGKASSVILTHYDDTRDLMHNLPVHTVLRYRKHLHDFMNKVADVLGETGSAPDGSPII